MMRFRLFLFGVLVLGGCDKPQPSESPRADTSRQTEESGVQGPALRHDSLDATPPDSLGDRDAAAPSSDPLEPSGPRTIIRPTERVPDSILIEPERPNDPGDVAGSCDVRSTEQFCFTYTGEGWSPGAAQEHCGQAPDTDFRTQACPVDKRIATCVFRRDDDPAQEITYTYYEPFDPALAEIACPGEFQLVE